GSRTLHSAGATRRGGGGRGHDEGPVPQREPGLLVTRRPARTSLLVAALVAGLAKQLAVLLLGHTLAALLDDGAHTSSQCSIGRRWPDDGPLGEVVQDRKSVV